MYTFRQDILETTDASPWRPFIDIYERTDNIIVVVELPGVTKDDVSVTVEKGILSISGFRHKEIPQEAEHVHQMEIPHGPFKRSIKLHGSANIAKIQADFKDGFLTIQIPRKASHE
jgi:HSP20 family protein